MRFPVHDDPIGRALDEYGEWGAMEQNLLRMLVRRGTTVVDVGANLGTHTLSLARDVGPTGRVVAIEPQASIFALLSHNVASNEAPNVRLVQACAGSARGWARVPRVDLSLHFNFGAVAPEQLPDVTRPSDSDDAELVPILPLDELELSTVSLLKIDVEGVEAEVLRGAQHLIDCDRPVVYFEANTVEGASEAVLYLKQRGYRTYLHRAAAYNPENYRNNAVNTFGFAMETNVLAIPEAKVSEHADALANELVLPFQTLDELATLLFETPRYGDQTPYERSIPALRAEIAELQKNLTSAELSLQHAEERAAALDRSLLETELKLRVAERQCSELVAQRRDQQSAVHEAQGQLRDLEENLLQYEARAEILGRTLQQRDQDIRHLHAELTRTSEREAHERHRAAKAEAKKQAVMLQLSRVTSVRLARRWARVRKGTSEALAHGLAGSYQRVSKYLARRARHLQERRIIAESGIFDNEFYESQAGRTANPIWHYLTHGAKKGHNPHPLFSGSYYLKRYPELAKSPTNPFVHFLQVGGAEGRSPNKHFDSEYYLRQEPALAPGTNPLLHFLSSGAEAGRKPNPHFDPLYYLAINSEVKAAKLNPLVHYVRWGAKEKRVTQPPATTSLAGRFPLAPRPTAPSESEWAEAPPHQTLAARIDVIIPVYRGEADTLRCIHRVLSSRNETHFEVVVIDDCSPEPRLSDQLQELAARGLFTYLRNETNRGFVGTVNRGMSLHPERDVILLNSDTEVFSDWVDRLARIASERADVGTITPFSNSATICSYPVFAEDNEMQLEVSFAELDRIAHQVNTEEIVDLPTGVGFCMFIKRACLTQTGLFDEELFGKGYGEENDFCLRALKLGWRSVMACGIFVRHTGGASFQGEKAARIVDALKKLDTVHPHYQDSVRSFLSADPIAPFRGRIDLERARRAFGVRSIAFVSHGRGGGTEEHVQQLVAMARREGFGVLLLRPDSRDRRVLRVMPDLSAPTPNVPGLALDDVSESLKLFAYLNVQHVHVHHLVDMSTSALRWVEGLAKSGEVTVDFTVHDYSPICPRINLIDATNEYCGEPVEETVCNRCIVHSGSEFGIAAIGPFRRQFERMLASVRHVFVPNRDVAVRLSRYFPNLSFRVRPHPESEMLGPKAPAFRSGERLRVAVLGAIGTHKGYDVLLRCALDARARGLPIDFLVVGYTWNDKGAKRAGITVTGRYETNEQALEILAEQRVHVVFLPAVWPETYSYALSVALNASIHPVAFDFGAIAERLHASGDGTTLPLNTMNDPKAINDVFLALRASGPPRPAPQAPRSYTLSEYYQSDLASPSRTPSRAEPPRDDYSTDPT